MASTSRRTHSRSGHTDELLTLLYSLCKRVGNGSGSAGVGGEPTAGGEVEDAEEKAEEKLDRSEMWKGSVMQVAGLYSIMVACLLSVFIQQDCATTSCTSACLPGGGGRQVCTTTRTACSFKQNLSYTSGFGKLAIAFNFITLALFLVSQGVFYYREKFVVDAFSEDAHLPVENLQDEVKLYPRFKDRLQHYNQASVWLTSTLMVFLIVNLVLSSINILRFHYAGKASVIGLISNTGLVLVKVITMDKETPILAVG